MPCTNPIRTKYKDYRLRATVPIDVPCGKCPSCLASFTRGWEFRLKKTAECYKGFIYDTLTVRPADTPYLDYSEFYEDGCVTIPGDYCPSGVPHSFVPSKDSRRMLDHYDGKLPYLYRSIVSAWVKRCRNRLNNYRVRHGNSRLHLKYAMVLEYGPQWGRPHVHLVMFGIEWWEYVHFFADAWRFEFGFTKTKWVEGNDRASIGRVMGYLAKYFSKGSNDVPLLKDGLLPKPWRLLSHGIGEEYLSSPRCNLYKYLGLPKELWFLAKQTKLETADEKVVQFLFNIYENAFNELSTPDRLKFLDAYNCAYEDGFPLALPRYFRDKLLSDGKTSVLSSVLSSILLRYNSQRRYLELAQFASSLCGASVDEVLDMFKNSRRSYALWLNRFTDFKRRQAKVANDRIATKRRNFFNRSQRMSNGELFENIDFDNYGLSQS